jgi:hypothetical protein
LRIADKTRIFETVAVILTGIAKFIFMDLLNHRLIYITAACLFWGGYIVYRSQKNKGIIAYWGLSDKKFKSTFIEFLPFAILCIAVFVFVGNTMGTNILNWSILPILLLYPLWGIIQQFVIIGLLARNLKDIENINIPDFLIILITALVFSSVHYPNKPLIVATFFLAIVYTGLYLRKRNLIVMGIYHGWLGAFFSYTILARDSWKEVFGILGL